ncbi:hypothetical protein [Candidatus Laterigemmans baculatus]|uniref:hypothetical protein n=1 Tax=Candidatus Laterigemmans baculatus TaxID=2770505 RepID=UPI0013DC0AB7|nr:hypothetical protein [Candidatus Laterigemmans baculatus]
MQVSVIGFGSAPIGFLNTDIDAISKRLHFLLDAGVNRVDIAVTETSVNLCDQTKMYQDYARTYTERLAPMGLSLQELGVGHSGISSAPSEAWPDRTSAFPA